MTLGGISLIGCGSHRESDELVAERFDTRLRAELRNAVSSRKPVRLDRVATFEWDTLYFYSSNAEPKVGSAEAARKAAESTGMLARKDLDVVIVFMNHGRAVRTVTRLHGKTGVGFSVPSGTTAARDAALLDLVLDGSRPLAQLRLETT